MKKATLFTTMLVSCALCKAQDTLSISLQQAIAQSEYSVDALVAKNEFRASYWEYRTYKAELLPEAVLVGTIPHFSNSYNQLQNPDGTFTFVSNNFSTIEADLSINQNLPLTGGKLSVEASLQRLDQLGKNPATSYVGTPIQIALEQPIGGFNRIKWLKKIEPIKYNEAKARLAAQLEEVHLSAISHYFNLLLAQVSLESARQNYANSVKLYQVAEAKRTIGQLSENDLLQLRVTMLNAESYLSDAESNFNARMFQLRSFLGYSDNVILTTSIPASLSHQLQLSYPQVQALAMENSPFTQNIRKRQLEASRNLSQARAERWNATLFVSYGLIGQESSIPAVLDNLRGNQLVNVGVRVPIVDWGKGKGRVRVAESNRELVSSRIEKEQLEFNQNLFLEVESFNKQFKQLAIAKETDEIAQLRYNTSIEMFILDKIDVLNLNYAQTSKDDAKKRYIEQAYLLWSHYYQIRSLTLYDFIADQKLTLSYDDVIK